IPIGQAGNLFQDDGHVFIRKHVDRPIVDRIQDGAFAVAVLSLSEDFFRYWKTAGDQAFSNENPFAEPLRVHSNLSGGLGVFAAFQYDLVPLAAGTESFASVTLADLCTLSGLSLPICPVASR
ncbi:MAG: DUF4249 family protein, partial [Rhodothermales bacterium]|nr:DUF4249 family protein [Rhodothermales bacterium]